MSRCLDRRAPARAWCWRRCCSGVINRTKAVFAGRRGPPLLQAYYDFAKLLRKGAVYSRDDDLGVPRRADRRRSRPSLAALAARAAAAAPRRRWRSRATWCCSRTCSALARFFTRAGGARHRIGLRGHGREPRGRSSRRWPSRPCCLGAGARWPRRRTACRWRRSTRRCGPATLWAAGPVAAAGRGGAVRRVPGGERRIPVDDPNTHLELTMIHEVMVLDHGGPDLGVRSTTARR